MKTLYDLKREVWQVIVDADCVGKNAIDLIIDHLHAQGRIVLDGYVAVPNEAFKAMLQAVHFYGDDRNWENGQVMPFNKIVSFIHGGASIAKQAKEKLKIIDDTIAARAYHALPVADVVRNNCAAGCLDYLRATYPDGLRWAE